MDFNTTGGMRSPFSPRVKQSITGRRPIGLSSSKKTSSFMQSPRVQQTSDVIYKTPVITLETFGSPLPVMVTEALTFASGEVSARMSSCGWCWVVAGRRVLAWPREPSASAPGAPAAARELILPQTDLAHKADLVVLFYEDNAQMPSCIGVSPEGVVRYWSSVGQEGVYVDVSAELAGQECERLAERLDERPQSPLVLATTTCTVVLLTPTTVDGRPTVTCRTLRPPSGWLGGIGRRVSLLFFGSMPAHADTKLVGVVVLSGGGESVAEAEGEGGMCIALVSGGPLLQVWRGSELHEHHLRRPLCEAYARAHLAPQGDPNSLEIMALDVHASGPNSLLMLIASVNVARSPEMRYALANISVEQPEAPRVTSLQALRPARDDADEPPRCLPLPARVLLYTSGYVALVAGPNEKAEYIDVGGEGDRILGAALCDGAALLFSRKHGVLALATPPAAAAARTLSISMADSPMGSPSQTDMYDGNLTMYEIDPHEVNALTTDACGKLKTAFLFHVRRDPEAARVLAAVFPARQHQHLADVDAPLDRAVVRAARELLDDAPAGDPRWPRPAPAAAAAASPRAPHLALGSSSALQLRAQLADKQRAFALYLDFLRAHGLWRRLGRVSRESGDGTVSTHQVLGMLGERLAAARALRRLQEGGAQLIDAALHQVAHGGESEEQRDVAGDEAEGVVRGEQQEEEEARALSTGALSAADVAYRRVSRVTRVLGALARLPPPGDARAAAQHAAAVLAVLTSVVGEMHKFRAQWQAADGQGGAAWAPPEVGGRALLPTLIQLHTRAISECAHKCPDAALRAQVLEAGAALADLLLAEAAPLQRDPRTEHLYEAIRRDLIKPYVDEGQTRRAAALAEKFKDMELLVQLCVAERDLDRLHAYIDKYAGEGAAETAFAWLASRDGVHQALLIRELGPRVGARLSRWLSAVEDRAQLLALFHLNSSAPHRAAQPLLQLAQREKKSVARMTTTASLAKLCLLTSDRPCDAAVARGVDEVLALAEQHAALPADLKRQHALPDDCPVMSAADLLQMYVESESDSLTEYDYKKALDLAELIADPERRDELRLRVWCACIRHSQWWAGSEEPSAEQLRDNMFYRLVELVHLMCDEAQVVLPDLDELLGAAELAPLLSEPRIHFSLRYAYQCITAH